VLRSFAAVTGFRFVSVQVALHVLDFAVCGCCSALLLSVCDPARPLLCVFLGRL
jgi:hypothetical protein